MVSASPPRWPRAALAVLSAASLLAPAARAQEDSSQMSLIRDTEIEEILHREADPIFLAAGINPQTVQVHLVGTKEINAFNAGGQQIFLFSGLIMETKYPGQLIGVIAHETGHMAGGHLARSGEGEKSAMRTFLLTMGLGILAAAAGAPEAGMGLIGSSSYFATLNYLGYTREQEARADQAAATYIEKAGESGAGLVDFFNTFRYQEVFEDARRFPYFQDHPLSSDRIEALRVRVEKLPHYGVKDTPDLQAAHDLMIAKLKAFIDPPIQTLQDYKDTDTSFPARYARAIAYYKTGETPTALRLIEDLITTQPQNPYLYELKGQVLFEAGKTAESEAPYRRSVELKPHAPLLEINLAQTLVAENDPKKLDEAVTLLKASIAKEDDNAFSWRLLAQVYDTRNQPGLARFATAEQNFSLGNTTAARVFAVRARDLLPSGSTEWRRATDIILASQPGQDDLQSVARDGGASPGKFQ